jgi:hypothetical protein
MPSFSYPYKTENVLKMLAPPLSSFIFNKSNCLNESSTLFEEPLPSLILNSGAVVRQRTLPTEQPPLVGEISANFSG